jgi:hypothetical protein
MRSNSQQPFLESTKDRNLEGCTPPMELIVGGEKSNEEC